MNAKKIVIATLGAALLAGAAIPVLAAPGRDGPRGPGGPHGRGGQAMMQDVMFVRLLKTVDTNKDAKITKEEMATRQDALFTEADANKDGVLTRGEMLDYRQAKMEEFRKNNPPPERADKEEKKPGDDKMSDRREHRGDHDRADNRHGPGRHDRDRQEARFDGPRGGGMEGRGFFRMIDEDKDGKITKAEAVAASDKLFARLDTNKDGQITIDDLPNRPI